MCEDSSARVHVTSLVAILQTQPVFYHILLLRVGQDHSAYCCFNVSARRTWLSQEGKGQLQLVYRSLYVVNHFYILSGQQDG